MRALMMCLAVFAFQRITMQDKPVVYLRPHSDQITIDFGGQFLDLVNVPTVIYLPLHPPTVDEEGNPWEVDAKNLGPRNIQIQGKGNFIVRVSVGQTVHIHSNGVVYSLEK
jgi:hypothetical protein